MGCGASRHTELDHWFAVPKVIAARRVAPDLYVMAVESRRLAEAAQGRGERDAAVEYIQATRWFLAAAVAEADRVTLEKQRLEGEQRIRHAHEAAQRDSDRARDLREEIQLLAAERVASEESERAREVAESEEAKRHSRDAERTKQIQDASRFYIRRARLVLAAAISMKAPEARVAKVQSALEEAEKHLGASTALQKSDEALREARLLLGELRRHAHDAPTPDQVASLVTEAKELGFAVTSTDGGIAVRVLAFERPSSTRPQDAKMTKLASLLAAFPQGKIRLLLSDPAKRNGVAQRRLQSTVEMLGRYGVEGQRLEPALNIEASPQESMTVVFMAYAP